MSSRHGRSASLAIVLASIAVALSIALLVGWTLVVAQNLSLSGRMVLNTWLLVLGIISFIMIMSVLISFAVFLVREIREVRRQYSFIDSVTHELKSPLASIKLCLETMDREGVNPKQRDELRQMMRDDVDRLTVFIDDVLEASRLAHGSGQRGSAMTEIRIGELLERCRTAILDRYKLDEDHITITANDDDVVIESDRTALEIIFKNLLDNAVKYSDDTTLSVRVTVRVEPNQIIVDVTDSGIGIELKDQKRIFDRFYRVPEPSVRERRGTGIGLFVVSGLVNHIDGTLSAQSDGIGTGSTFTVSLPYDPTRQET